MVAVCKLSVSIMLPLLKLAMFAYDPSRCLCVMCCGVNGDFGSPIEEKVSDLQGLEGLEEKLDEVGGMVGL